MFLTVFHWFFCVGSLLFFFVLFGVRYHMCPHSMAPQFKMTPFWCVPSLPAARILCNWGFAASQLCVGNFLFQIGRKFREIGHGSSRGFREISHTLLITRSGSGRQALMGCCRQPVCSPWSTVWTLVPEVEGVDGVPMPHANIPRFLPPSPWHIPCHSAVQALVPPTVDVAENMTQAEQVVSV